MQTLSSRRRLPIVMIHVINNKINNKLVVTEGGHGNLLQYSCLENPHGQRSLVGYSPKSRKESDMTEAT